MQTGDITALRSIVNHLPGNIKDALEAYSADTGMPLEFIIEMAIASFLDVDSTTFADCRTDSPGRLRERIEILQIQLAAAKANLQ